MKKSKFFYDLDLRINHQEDILFDFDLRINHQKDVHLIHVQYIRPVQIMTILLDFDTSSFQSFDESIEKKDSMSSWNT